MWRKSIWWLWLRALVYLEVLVRPWAERQLHATFGKQYAVYEQRMRKWLPVRT